MPKLYAVATILAVSLLLGAAEPGGPAVGGATARLAWDHSGLAADGSPETVVEFEIGVYSPDGLTQIATRTIATCGTGSITCQEALAPFGLASGVYSLRVRAIDVAGNPSAWSDSLQVALDLVPPAKPTGCRLLRN